MRRGKVGREGKREGVSVLEEKEGRLFSLFFPLAVTSPPFFLSRTHALKQTGGTNPWSEAAPSRARSRAAAAEEEEGEQPQQQLQQPPLEVEEEEEED